MWIFLLHTILTFPREFWPVSCIPSNFDEFDTTPVCLVNFPISNLNWFFNKVERVVDMNFVSRNDHCLLSWTLFQVRYMECIMNAIKFSR
ncbi:hypothetical protein Hanom_Chr02g00134551 [Helianthus anomalus]